jgi:hypothetical protein
MCASEVLEVIQKVNGRRKSIPKNRQFGFLSLWGVEGIGFIDALAFDLAFDVDFQIFGTKKRGLTSS